MMAWVQRGTAYCVLLFVGVTVEVRAQNATSTSSQTALSTDNATKPAESGEREKVDAPPSLSAATLAMRRARCATAICFGQDFKYGLEPLVELPVGKTFTSNGLGALANFENSHDISATFTAGLRFWILHDAISFSIYLSKPLFAQHGTLRVAGSPFEYGEQNVRRPYPGLALGFLADVIWIGMDIDELRNGDTDTTRDPNFPRNAVVSRAPVFTIALSPITLTRNALGNVTSAAPRPPAK